MKKGARRRPRPLSKRRVALKRRERKRRKRLGQRPPPHRGALSLKQRAFIDAYTTPGAPAFRNASQAAIQAGYSRKTAYAAGSRLLRHPVIRAEIVRTQNTTAQRADFDRERALFAALEMAQAWKGPDGRPVKGVHPDATNLGALELACKIAGIRTPYGEPFNRLRAELTGRDGGPIAYHLEQLKDDELTTLEQLLRRAAPSRS